MSAGLVIRDARPDELEALLRITFEAYDEYRTLLAPPAWRGLAAAIHRAFEPMSSANRIVAEVAGEVVGSVLLFPAGVETYGGSIQAAPWPEMRLLAVPDRSRGKGVGRALVEECLRRAAGWGADRLGIHTSASMRVAREMYRRMGFARAPEFDFHPAGGEVVEAYTLDLTQSRESDT